MVIQSKILRFRIAPALLWKLKQYCSSEGVSMSAFIKELIEKELREYAPPARNFWN